MKNGFILIDQYRAHARILFDQLVSNAAKNQVQKLLFTEKFEVEKVDLPIWKEILEDLNDLGFELQLEGHEIEILGQPHQSKEKNPVQLVTQLFESYKLTEQNEELEIKSKLALSLASGMAIKGGTTLTTVEMEHLIDELFASSSPQISPHGKKIIETFSMDEIIKRFS